MKRDDLVTALNFMAGAAEEGFGEKYSDAKVFRSSAALISAQASEIERLRHLLLPFADEAFTYDCDEEPGEKKLIPGEYFLMIEEGDGTLTQSAIRVDDLRKARAALQSSPDGMGEDELGSNTDKLQRKEF